MKSINHCVVQKLFWLVAGIVKYPGQFSFEHKYIEIFKTEFFCRKIIKIITSVQNAFVAMTGVRQSNSLH